MARRRIIYLLVITLVGSSCSAPSTPETPSGEEKDLKHSKPLDVVHSSFGEALNDLFKKLEIQDDGPYQLNSRPEPKNAVRRRASGPPKIPSFPYHYQGYPFDYVNRRAERPRSHLQNGYPPPSSKPYGNHEKFHCPGNGLYYRDETSFYSCASGQYNVLHCAPGTRNKPRQAYEKREYTESGELIKVDFCSVNLVALVPNHPDLHADYPYY